MVLSTTEKFSHILVNLVHPSDNCRGPDAVVAIEYRASKVTEPSKSFAATKMSVIELFMATTSRVTKHFATTTAIASS